MPYVASIGTRLSCWGPPNARMSGIDEHVTTLAVRGSGAAERVEMLGRELPPTEASNAAEPSARLGRPTAVAAVTIPEGARRGG